MKTTLSLTILVLFLFCVGCKFNDDSSDESDVDESSSSSEVSNENETEEQEPVCELTKAQKQCSPLPELDSFVKEDQTLIDEMNENIETYRKGDVTITVQNSSQEAISDINVYYSLIQPDFYFGTYFDYFEPPNTDAVCLMKEAGTNTAYVMLDWMRTQPNEGQFDLENVRKDSGIEALRREGYTLASNALVWMWREWLVPGYAYNIASRGYNHLLSAIKEHVREVVSYFADDIHIWNLINEPLASWTNCFNLDEDQVIEIIIETGKIVAEEDPTAIRLINFAVPTGTGYVVDPHDLLEQMPEDSYDGIGLQIYFNGCLTEDHGSWPQDEFTLPEIRELFDDYAVHGKDLYVTEFSAPSKMNSTCSTYRGEDWTWESQALYIHGFLSLVLGYPEIKMFSFWDTDDAYDPLGPFVYHGGLFNENFEAKDSWDVLKHWTRCLTPDADGTTDSNGEFSFRGFAGEYEITISDGETSKTYTISIEEQDETKVELEF